MRSFLACCLLASIAQAAPESSADKIKQTPDFCQTDKAGKFYDNGRNFCAPTAVSNSFVWLSQNGFPQLVDHHQDLKSRQANLINRLADKPWMNTVSNDGTGPGGLMAGVEKHVKESGYQIERMECQGWRPLKRKYAAGEIVSLDWLKQAIANPRGAAWLNIGWYQHDKAANAYRRNGGHWITLVGYGIDAQGNPDSNALVAYDPAPRSGAGEVAHYFHPRALPEVELVGTDKGLPRSGKGYFQIVDGIVPKKSADAVIIDAAVILILRPAQPSQATSN